MAKYHQTDIALRLGDIRTLYQRDVVNYTGYADEGTYYSEIIAGYLLDHLDLFDQIRPYSRIMAYRNKSHDGSTSNLSGIRPVELIELAMYGKTYPEIGEIIDYRMPIKNISADKSGKVNLVSHHDGMLFLLKLKSPDNQDTLLRCILQIATYWRRIDRDKLMEEWNERYPATEVKAGIVVFENSFPHMEHKSGEIPKTIELMGRLGVDLYIISDPNDSTDYQIRKA